MQTKSILLQESTIETLRKLAFEDHMTLSSYVRKVLEAHVKGHGNKLVEVVKQADEVHKEYVRKTKWKEVVNPDGTVDLVEDTDE